MSRWVTQNKKIPGAYINFKSIPRPRAALGDRGIAAMLMPLSWGAIDEVIDVYSEDMLDINSLRKIGITAFDPEARLLAGMLNYCYLARIIRMNIGGEKATADIPGTAILTVTAMHFGVLGNEITIKIDLIETDVFAVETYVLNQMRDRQLVRDYEDLQANDWVTFIGEGTPTINAGVMLTGGTDGTVNESTAYVNAFPLLSTTLFQTLAVPTNDTTVKEAVVRYVFDQREEQGKPIQAVLSKYSLADFEGIISVDNSVIFGEVEWTSAEMTAIVAGMNSGAMANQSNTGRIVAGATAIIGELSKRELENALTSGKFVFSANQDGRVKVTQDINSLHTFTLEKGREFRKNRIIRTLDEIEIRIRNIWETTYLGKVNNNAEGREIFKTDILSLMSGWQSVGIIQEFAGAEHLQVRQGEDLDIVVCDMQIKPVDSMEFLYLTVSVGW